MTLADTLTAHAARFKTGILEVGRRRRSWDAFQDLAREVFSKAVSGGARAGLFDVLYVDPDTAPAERYLATLQHISLVWGRHHIGLTESSGQTGKLVIEGGCALHAGQDYLGGVALILYPFTSTLHPSGPDYILLGFWRDPLSVSQSRLETCVRQFLSFAQVTSAFGSPSTGDRLTVFWLRRRSAFLELGISGRVKIVADAVSQTVGAVKAVGKAMALGVG
jgi:hypothetical protein